MEIRIAERKEARGEDAASEGGHWVRVLRGCADQIIGQEEG